MGVRLPYVQYNLLLCRDNSVHLDLMWSCPPKFKDTSCKIYDDVGCFTNDCITDILEEVERIVMYNDKFLTNIVYETYE